MIATTTREWEAELGKQIRTLRLRLDLDQKQLAERAGIALNAVKNLETGKGASLHSLIQVLRILNRTDWLGSLAPTVSISPVQMLKTKTPRARLRCCGVVPGHDPHHRRGTVPGRARGGGMAPACRRRGQHAHLGRCIRVPAGGHRPRRGDARSGDGAV